MVMGGCLVVGDRDILVGGGDLNESEGHERGASRGGSRLLGVRGVSAARDHGTNDHGRELEGIVPRTGCALAPGHERERGGAPVIRPSGRPGVLLREVILWECAGSSPP